MKTYLLALVLLTTATGLGRVLQQSKAQAPGTGVPGEVAGTLLLGGFRGLACDVVWMRMTSARAARRTYESVALAKVVTRIQPRFVRAWEHLSWDQAFNLAADQDTPEAKLGWMEAGMRSNIEGCVRNPGEERLIRHAAWMFFNRISYVAGVAERDWTPLVTPVFEATAQVVSGHPAPPANESPYVLAARLYRLAIQVGAARGKPSPGFVLRLVAVCHEREGDRLLSSGHGRAALQQWLACVHAWSDVAARFQREGDWYDQDSFQRNDEQIRRKAAALCRDLGASQEIQDAWLTRDLAKLPALLTTLPDRAPRPPVFWLDADHAATAKP